MEDGRIHKLGMPKWGLSMTHGKIVQWLVSEGDEISVGTQVVEVETEKVTNCVESPIAGTLRRLVAQSEQEIPVGGLLAVIADDTVAEDEIDRFVENFTPEDVVDNTEVSDIEPEFVEVNDRQFRFLKRGEGEPPAVLIHGFTGDLNNWLFNHGALASDRAVYALDLPGHGQSSKDVNDGSLEFMVDAVCNWLDAVKLPPAHFVGHSLGGAIVLALAVRHPDRVLSCTLIASVGLGPEIDHEYIAGVIGAGRRKQLKPHLERLFADPSQVTRQLVDDMLKFKRLDGVERALRTIADSFVIDGTQGWRLENHMPQLSVPLLAIWGFKDRILPVSHAAGLPSSVKVEIIKDSGHMVQMEAAGDVNRIVTAFLQETTPTSATKNGDAG